MAFEITPVHLRYSAALQELKRTSDALVASFKHPWDETNGKELRAASDAAWERYQPTWKALHAEWVQLGYLTPND